MVEPPVHTKQILSTGFYTGMRKGEILGLTWDKVDMKNRVISLDTEDTKNGEGRNVPIMEPLYEILKGLPRPIHHGHVFTLRGKFVKDLRAAISPMFTKPPVRVIHACVPPQRKAPKP